MSQHVTLAKPESPLGTAQRVFDKCGNDKAKATEELIRLATTNKTLARDLIQRGAERIVDDVIRGHNKHIYSGSPVGSTASVFTATSEAITAAQMRARGSSARQARMLLDVILPNRVVMRDATRDDIAATVAFYEPQARDMMQKVAYYRAVYSGLVGKKTVGETFDNATLTKLLENARSEE
jgi:hypothetical protein